MNLLDRHIFRSVLLTCAAAVGLFAFVVAVPNVVRDLLGPFLAGQFGAGTFARLVALLFPFAISFALPMGILTGVLLTLGRLSADSEITAMRACGISLPRIARPVAILAVLGTLLARAFYLQVMEGAEYRAAAADNTVREVVDPAVRGLILDQAGRPLVANRTSVVVTVDRQELAKEDDDGAAVIRRLAGILDTPVAKISDRLVPCGTEGAKPPPVCWCCARASWWPSGSPRRQTGMSLPP